MWRATSSVECLLMVIDLLKAQNWVLRLGSYLVFDLLMETQTAFLLVLSLDFRMELLWDSRKV